MKQIAYTFRLTNDTQISHIHLHHKNQVISFTVQRVDKTTLFSSSFKEALTFADGDLRSNWILYRDNFLKEVRNE